MMNDVKNTPPEDGGHVTMADVAERLGCHVNTVKRLITSDAFPGAFQLVATGSERKNAPWRIPSADVDAYLVARRAAARKRREAA